MTAPTPPIPSFEEGQVVTAQQLNDFSANLADLYDTVMGGFKTNIPVVVKRATTAQSIASNVDQLLSWQVEDIDIGGQTTAASTSIDIVQSGVYRIGLHVQLGALSGDNSRLITVRMNRNSGTPTTNPLAIGTAPGRIGAISAAVCGALVPLAAADQLRGWVRHSGTAAVNTFTTFGGVRMFAHWVSPLP